MLCAYMWHGLDLQAPGQARIRNENERLVRSALTSLPSISNFSGNFGQSEMCPVGRTGKKIVRYEGSFFSDHRGAE